LTKKRCKVQRFSGGSHNGEKENGRRFLQKSYSCKSKQTAFTMGKIIYYVAASLDGYIADENGGVDWLLPFQDVPYDYGYQDFMKRIGFIVTGSRTFEQAKDFPGGWNFPGTHTYLCSSRPFDREGRKDLTLWPGNVQELGGKLRVEEKDTWLIGGAALAASFFNAGLLDELILSVMPLVLGKGRPLFDGLRQTMPLLLQKVQDFPNGVVQMNYVFG
jgi:dihydrofolate reductase